MIADVDIPREITPQRDLRWLQEANRRTLAAEAMARRSLRYTQLAATVAPQRWLYWALRALRANEASIRLMESSERLIRRAFAERRTC